MSIKCATGLNPGHNRLSHSNNTADGLAFTGDGFDNGPFLTGDYRIDSMMMGAKWGNLHVPARITFSFDATNEIVLDDDFRSTVNYGLRKWAEVADIKFSYKPPSPDNNNKVNILFGADSTLVPSGFAGVALIANDGNKMADVDVLIATEFAQTSVKPGDNFGYLVIIHEIGHALGLKHVGSNGIGGQLEPFLPAEEDNTDFSVMSYNDGSGYPVSPMPYDILAIQHLYGPNRSHNAGPTSYIINGGSEIKTIWDGEGIDTYDATSYAGDSTINIGDGQKSIVGNSNIWTAFFADIENVITQDGNNTVIGNSLSNSMKTGRGNDFIQAGRGKDTLNGGAGNDTIIAGNGSDIITGGNGNDVLNGGAASDIFVFRSGSGVDVIQDFIPNVDKLHIIGVFQSVDAAVAAFQGGAIDFGSGNLVTLSGVAGITANDIIIG